jgi:hypothetical protein
MQKTHRLFFIAILALSPNLIKPARPALLRAIARPGGILRSFSTVEREYELLKQKQGRALFDLKTQVESNNPEEVTKILASGQVANVNDCPGYSDDSILHIAACVTNLHPKILHALLDAGANVSQRNNPGETPLHHACRRVADGRGNPQTIEVLLQRGANPKAYNDHSQLPADFFLRKETSQYHKELLLNLARRKK